MKQEFFFLILVVDVPQQDARTEEDVIVLDIGGRREMMETHYSWGRL